MKTLSSSIAALLAFRNEEIFMETYMLHMSKFADIILGFDDDSSDNSRDIFLRNGGIFVPSFLVEIVAKVQLLISENNCYWRGEKKAIANLLCLIATRLLLQKNLRF